MMKSRLLRSATCGAWRASPGPSSKDSSPRRDNFLPPDNYQEDPAPVLAHRSSPTNFGLYLLSTLAARDFGWLGLHAMTERMTATLADVEPSRALRRDISSTGTTPRHSRHCCHAMSPPSTAAISPDIC